MPLNRGWFDALVDDDGSNTVGTVWNKAQVDGLLDSVDQAVASSWVSWNPTWRHADNSPQTPAQNSCRYTRNGTYGQAASIYLTLYVHELFFGSDSVFLTFTLPPGFPPVTPGIEQFLVRIRQGQDQASMTLGYIEMVTATEGRVWRMNQAPFLGFTHWSIYGQGLYFVG